MDIRIRTAHHATVAGMLARLPGPVTPQHPTGLPFATAIHHGSMSVELYAPDGEDLQQPHAQDELYVVVSGAASLDRDGEVVEVRAHDVVFVPAGMEHRFVDLTEDFSTWVIFWGPGGGERARS